MARDRSGFWEWLKSIFIAIIVAFLIKTFILTASVVEGASMEPTLLNQDRIILTKIGEPQRFDIIAFHVSEEKNYIKRVIGFPGERIEFKADILYINGVAYDEPYLQDFKQEVERGPLTYSFTLEETAVEAEVVPEGHLFVMGDNRQKSIDSRHIGAIPFEEIIGTTRMVYFPFTEIKVIGNK